MWYLKEIPVFLWRCGKILSKWYIAFLASYLNVVFTSVTGIKHRQSATHTNIAWNSLYLPNNYVAFLVAYEIFVAELYRPIKWCQQVLDLWGYIWDSAVYLAQQNQQVTVVESDPHNFSFIQKNTSHLHNVTALQGAIVADASQKLYLIEDNIYWWTVATAPHPSLPSHEIATITLAQLLQEATFDALKMDIEGGEYPLLTYMIEQDVFPFTKGFIELHFTPQEYIAQYTLFLKFGTFLTTKWYVYDLFDNDGNTVRPTELHTLLAQGISHMHYLNIYFQKATF